MKTCLIPPIAHLSEFGQGDFHLLLAHLVESRDYATHYREQKLLGAYTVLDNGAHENNAGMTAQRLLVLSWALRASEIVLPDELFNASGTINRTRRAIDYLTQDDVVDQLRGSKLRMMLVPQGFDPYEWRTCLQTLLIVYDRARRKSSAFEPPVIGLSKDYEMWDGGLAKLLRENILPTGNEVHLLGWGRDLWALGDIAHRWGDRIRSTDTAKPFVYALAGVELDPSKPPPKYPKRPSNYFDVKMTDEQRAIARHNVDVYRALVNGN